MVALAHEDRVGVDTRADHKQRLGLAAHLQAFALADREKVGAVMLAHHRAHVGTKGESLRPRRQIVALALKDLVTRLDFHNVATLHRELLLQEIGETHLADEAQTLGVLFVCSRQSDVCRDLTHLGFVQLPDGEEGASKLFLVQLTEEIALVLVAILAREQVMYPLVVGHLAAIVPSGHRFSPQF